MKLNKCKCGSQDWYLSKSFPIWRVGTPESERVQNMYLKCGKCSEPYPDQEKRIRELEVSILSRINKATRLEKKLECIESEVKKELDEMDREEDRSYYDTQTVWLSIIRTLLKIPKDE